MAERAQPAAEGDLAQELDPLIADPVDVLILEGRQLIDGTVRQRHRPDPVRDRVVEIGGFGVEPTGRHNDGCFMAVFNVAAFRPLKDFKKEVAEFARYLKSTPPSEGSNGVFYPGEIEFLREQERRKSGIEIEDATWEKLRALAGEYKLAAELGLA